MSNHETWQRTKKLQKPSSGTGTIDKWQSVLLIRRHYTRSNDTIFNASTPKNLTSSTIFHPQESHIVSGNELSLSAFIFFPMGPGCCHAAAEPPGGSGELGADFQLDHHVLQLFGVSSKGPLDVLEISVAFNLWTLCNKWLPKSG